MSSNAGFGRYRWEYRRKLFTENELVLLIRKNNTRTCEWEPLTPSRAVSGFIASELLAIKREIETHNRVYPSHKLDLVVRNGKYELVKVSGVRRLGLNDADFGNDYMVSFLARFPINWDAYSNTSSEKQ